MNCIFCRSESSASKSVEHIVPHSLGNTEHVLPPGIVCDKCNQYFAVKVEGPLLSAQYSRHLRFRNAIPSKKGRVPPLEDLMGQEGIALGLRLGEFGHRHLYPLDDRDGPRFTSSILGAPHYRVFGPEPFPLDTRLVSRLLAKMALEILTDRVMVAPGWEEEVVFRPELDLIRQYARFGVGPRTWPYHERRIYEEHRPFIGEDGEIHVVLHEFQTLYTDSQELYVVVAILGVEYTINVGGPTMEGYLRWLEEHHGRSPLYPGGIG